MIKARIYVSLQASVFDPQSKAIENALQVLGYNNVEEIKTSKCFELTFNKKNKEAVEKQVAEICDKLLVNVNIENYRYELVEDK